MTIPAMARPMAIIPATANFESPLPFAIEDSIFCDQWFRAHRHSLGRHGTLQQTMMGTARNFIKY